MIDWSKIDNWQLFQRLVNHLFALECNSPGFIPSSPYIGADGGFDGYYSGHYYYENLEGKYSIQSKWTTKSGKKAVEYLKQEMKKELKTAETKGVEHLRIATYAELNKDQVIELESLDKGEVKTLQVWHRENLTIRIEKKPFLRHYFFGDPQYPALVPWDIYFSKLEPHLTSFSFTEIPKFERYQREVEKFLLSKREHLLLIHSPEGEGKSHLCREIAKISHQIDSTREPWLIKAGYRSIEKILQEEIVTGRKYLLILDDADRNLNDINPLLAFLRSGNVDLKLILSFRTSGYYLIQQKIIESKCSEISKEMKISDWTKDELIKLLRMIMQTDKVKDEELIVTYYPNPYLIVWLGNQLKKKPISDFSKLKDKFVNDIVYDAQKCLNGIIKNKIKHFLFTLACIVPFSIERIEERITSNFYIDKESFKEAIKRLLEAGIIRYVGKTIRFKPDIKGDLYLGHILQNLDEKFFMNFVLEWIPVYPENVFTNIGAASKYGEMNVAKKVLVNFFNQWVEDAEKTPGSTREKNLKLAEKITSLVPQEVINLVSVYLDTPQPNETNPIYKMFDINKFTITTDNYGPIIYELMSVSSVRRDLVNIIEKIANLNITGTYDNYKPGSLIRKCVSPLSNSFDNIFATLDILAEWLDKPNDVKISLLKSALSEVLAGAHEYTRTLLEKFEFGERPLLKHPKTLEMRNKALTILKKMIAHNILDIQLAALEVAGNIGKLRMGILSEKDLPLAEKIAGERREIVEEIGKLIKPDSDFKLLNAIENLFINWWAQETPGTENVVDFLGSFPKSPEYMVFRYMVSPSNTIEDFSAIEKIVPTKERWRWFVDFESQKMHMRVENFSSLAEEINKKYNSELQIISFLIELDKKVSSFNPWVPPLFLSCWIKINPSIFKKIREEEKLWVQVPERFKREIDFVISDIYSENIQRIAQEILITLPNVPHQKIDLLLILIEQRLPEPWKEWVERLIEDGTSEIRTTIVHHLNFIFQKTKNIENILYFLISILTKEEKLTYSLVKTLPFSIHHLDKEMNKSQFKKRKLQERLFEMLKNYPFLSSWEAQELFKFCTESIEIDGIISFFEHRLNKSQEIRSRREFEPVPFEEIRNLETKVNSFEDYTKLINKILDWHEEGKLYDFDIKHLITPANWLQDKETKEIYSFKYLKKLLEENSIKKALSFARFLPLISSTIDIFIEVLEKGIESSLYNEAKSLLLSKTDPEGAYSFKPGEPPPPFVHIKDTFNEMANKVSPGKLKTLLKECIKRIEADIENHLKNDEEFFTPRG